AALVSDNLACPARSPERPCRHACIEAGRRAAACAALAACAGSVDPGAVRTPAAHLPLPAPPASRQRISDSHASLQAAALMCGVNEATVAVPWEIDLTPGPVGEYLEVVDV